MMKNAFYFILKGIFDFAMTFLSCSKNALIREKRLLAKFMTSQPGEQTIAIHILPVVSRRKDNHTMKLGQLIEHKKRKIFLQKLYRK